MTHAADVGDGEAIEKIYKWTKRRLGTRKDKDHLRKQYLMALEVCVPRW